MKKILLIGALLATLVITSCVKEKNCRCSVLGYQRVRLVTIEGGSCESLNTVLYDDTIHVGSVITDTVLCVEY